MPGVQQQNNNGHHVVNVGTMVLGENLMLPLDVLLKTAHLETNDYTIIAHPGYHLEHYIAPDGVHVIGCVAGEGPNWVVQDF